MWRVSQTSHVGQGTISPGDVMHRMRTCFALLTILLRIELMISTSLFGVIDSIWWHPTLTRKEPALEPSTVCINTLALH
jgi:hypothetical protein